MACSRGKAHPRSRGENLDLVDGAHLLSGSSPLTRGKHQATDLERFGEGLIPAHAGKTARPGGSRRRSPAHPRSRGENPSSGRQLPPVLGSSPLTRGKPPLYRTERPILRLIPAHAGKTLQAPGEVGSSPAHPRSRGENCPQRDQELRRWGSSPLTRGKRADRRLDADLRRLIPAHAGKTCQTPDTTVEMPGSSPLTRGKQPGPPRSVPGSRLIPAHAGKTRRQRRRGNSRWLIPAHAGKTSNEPPTFWKPRAHPRSRGENRNTRILGNKLGGSSPLTRGKHATRDDAYNAAGLIPAHAGKT